MNGTRDFMIDSQTADPFINKVFNKNNDYLLIPYH